VFGVTHLMCSVRMKMGPPKRLDLHKIVNLVNPTMCFVAYH
jgi:hypothetical protein